MGLEIAHNTIKAIAAEYNNQPVLSNPFSAQTSGLLSLTSKLEFSKPEEFSFHFLTKSEIDSLPGWTYHGPSYISYSSNGISFTVYLNEPQSNGIFYKEILISSLEVSFPQQETEIQIPLTGTHNEYDMADARAKFILRYTSTLLAVLKVEAVGTGVDDDYFYTEGSGNWTGTITKGSDTLDIKNTTTFSESVEMKKDLIVTKNVSANNLAKWTKVADSATASGAAAQIYISVPYYSVAAFITFSFSGTSDSTTSDVSVSNLFMTEGTETAQIKTSPYGQIYLSFSPGTITISPYNYMSWNTINATYTIYCLELPALN